MPAKDSERTACIECDLIVTIGELADGQRALCPRCGHLLTVHGTDALTRSLAYALSSLMLLVMANAYPFLQIKAGGMEQVMTLPSSALDLYRDGYAEIAVLVMGPIIVVPALILLIVVALLVPILSKRSAPWLVPAGKLLFRLAPWSMVEVFVIGVLVSLVKIGAMATVVIGISFWSYVAFAICFTATLASLDRLRIWEEIEVYAS